MKKLCFRILVSYLVVAMFVIGITPRAEAAFSPSELLAGGHTDREADLQSVRAFLEMKMVVERFQQLGFSPKEIQMRLGELNDEQIHQIALHIDQSKVGGDGLGVVIAVLVIVILVILILRLVRIR